MALEMGIETDNSVPLSSDSNEEIIGTDNSANNNESLVSTSKSYSRNEAPDQSIITGLVVI